MLVLMLFLCINAGSATEPLNQTLGADIGDEIAIGDASNDRLSASGETYVVDANGGDGTYSSISAAVSNATGGETILIKNGEYIINSTITFEKSLNVVGESKDGVSIKSSMPDSELFVSTTDGVALSFSNLIIKDSSKTGGTGFIRFGSSVNADFVDCTFQNMESKYGVMQLSTTGTVNIENCKFNDIKCSGSNGAAGIYTSTSTTINIKDTVFDNEQFTLTSGQVGGVIYMSSAGSKLYMDNVTIQNFNGPANSVVRSTGIVDIRKSKIVNNTVTLSSSGYVGESLFYTANSGQLTIEQTIIADNNLAKNVFYFASGASATVNYNNIYNNVHNSSYQAGYKTTAGTLNAENNYWGSNDKPADVTATTWVVEENGEYKLNNGDALEKDIPGLTGGDEPQPAAYDVYVSPEGTGDGSSIDTPTNIYTALEIVPEGGSIFMSNGEYACGDAIYITKPVNIVGESREGVLLAPDWGIIIGNSENLYDQSYQIMGSVSLSSLTFDSVDSSCIIFVSCSVEELDISDCALQPINCFISVSTNVMGEPMETVGTFNFKKNVLTYSDMYPIRITGSWDANINNNIFLNTESGENAVSFESIGILNVEYNYWGSNSPATPLNPENYIVIDINSNASEIYNDESAKITIKVNLNDGSSAASHLPDYPIAVSLSAEGTLSQTDLVLSKGLAQVTYTSDVARNDNIGINVLGQTLSVPITVKERYTGIVYVNTTGSDDNEGSINAPVATVGKAIELANAGSHEIIINEGTYVGNGYAVTDDLKVTGNGKVTLDANNEGGFFATGYPTDATKIELSNLILANAKGGVSAGSGCAINSYANEVILDNVTIINSQANGYLIKSNGKLTIKDSNIAKSMSGNVIRQDGSGDIIITNTTFKDNSIVDTTSVYGVIYLSSGSGTLTIEDSKFINNTARQGVIKGSNNYNIAVSGSEFINNTDEVSYGGAIYATGSTLTVSDSKFINNKANRDGGAIYVGSRTTATVDKSVFINNAAGTTSEGDAIYNGNKLSVSNSVLLTNAAHHLIYNDGEDNVVNAQNNWWGTNDDPSNLVASGTYEDYYDEEQPCGEVDVSNWATMDASFTPDDAQAGDEVTVTAVFSNANLPDGIEVTFTSTSGLNTVVSTVGAQASTTYTIAANDEAITATSSDAVIEMPIASPALENIVTQDNFYTFFDDNGILLDTVGFDELIFQGSFSDLAAGYVILTKPITITGDNAVLNNMGIVVSASDVTLNDLTLIANTSLGDLVYVEGSNVNLNNLDITYTVGDESARAISIIKSTDVNVNNATIAFESHLTDSANDGCAINIEESQKVVVNGSEINSRLPALYVNYEAVTTQFMGLDKVNPIRIVQSNNVEITKNIINSQTNDYSQAYATIQAIAVLETNDCLIDSNNITLTDEFAQAGQDIYLYGISFAYDEGLVMSNNNFTVYTEGGKKAAGTAYAIQGIESELSIIGNNITTFSNGPNLGIYVTSMAGENSVMLIENNFINVTGLAAEGNNWALVSGIEIQNGDSKIYNNTIYTYNVADEYNEGDFLSGISYIQWMYGGRTFDIQDNTVYTEGKYAIYLLDASNSIITGNTLYAHDLGGSDAVFIQSGDNNDISGNRPTNVVTNDTFYEFFDDNGLLLDTVSYKELIFQGEFSDLVSHITLDRPISITGDEAELNDIAFIIAGDDVTLDNMTLVANSDLGNLIDIAGENAVISNNNITYVVTEAANAINVYPDANGAQILNNNIHFESTVDEYASDKVTNAICVNSGVSVFDDEDPITGLVIDGNNITAVIPAFLADVYENEYYVMGISYVNGVRINGAEDFKFTNNNLNVTTNWLYKTTPTYQAIYVASSSGLIDANNITMIDTFTPAGKDVYIDAMVLIKDEDLTISNNNFNISTTGGKEEAGSAYAIVAIESDFSIIGNNITTVSNGPNLAVYFPARMGAPCDAVIADNFMNVTGLATSAHDTGLVSGVEVQTGDVLITGNTIYTYSIGDYADDNYLFGISYAQDGADPEWEITDNTIYTEGKYAISLLSADGAVISGNTLYAHDLTGDEAVYIASGSGNTVDGNLPETLTNIVTNDTFYSYFDADGILLDTITFDELIFEGPFSDLVNVITFNRPINATTENAVLNDIAIKVTADDVNLTGFELKASKEFADNEGALIYVTGSDVKVDDIAVNYTAPSQAKAIGVYANAADNFALVNSEIIYDSFSLESGIKNALKVSNSNNVLIKDNVIDASMIASDIQFDDEDWSIMYYLSNVIDIQGGSDVNITSNSINVISNEGVNEMSWGPSIFALYVKKTDDILINLNNITLIDKLTNGAARSYYGIYLENLEGCIDQNNIIVNTTSGMKGQGGAYDIQVAGSEKINVNITGNNLTSISKGPGLGIQAYLQSNLITESNVLIKENDINVTGNPGEGAYEAPLAGIDAGLHSNNIYNNTIIVNSIGDYNENDKLAGIFNQASLQVDSAYDIKDNNITTNGKYAIKLPKAVNSNITANTLYAHELEGDKAVYIESGENNIVKDNLPEPKYANMSIVADAVWIGSNGTVVVNVPDATGTVTIEINGKSYPVELDNGVATKEIPAEDLVAGENIINATYEGPEFETTVKTGSLWVLNGVVTQENYMYYFNQADEGRLFDCVPEGATLDFQGSIINPDSSIIRHMNVNKPVNIVSTTKDAYVDLNTIAGSLMGESPGNSFAITNGGSGTNVTGIKFHNTQLWLANTHYVVLDNISAIVENQRVGSGVGVTSIRENSTFVTVKNSYFYTENNGGSSSLVLAWAQNCTWDNNTIEVVGDVGNMLYLNTFNVNIPSGVVANQYNVIKNNVILATNRPSAPICWGIVINGQNNLVENNTVYYAGVGIAAAFGGISANNTYIGNKLYNGSSIGGMGSFTACTFEDNYVSGTVTVGPDCNFYGNTFEAKATISGAGAVVENSTFKNEVTISGAGVTFIGNNVTNTVTVNSNDNVIKANNITTTGNYAVDLKAKTGNNVTDNYLVASVYKGDRAVKYSNANNIVENNLPRVEITVAADSIWIGSNGLVTVNVVNGTGSVTIKVNGKEYTAELNNGVATKEIPSEDLVVSKNEVTATYESAEYAPATNTTVLAVLDGVVTQDTYMYYFNQEEDGKLFDCVPEGATLDFQGSIINPDTNVKVNMNLTKPVNIISTTGDAYVDLNTTAHGGMGQDPGNRFTVSRGGSGSNITGIYFHNTQLWISNTSNVVFDNISVVAEGQSVGSGVGVTSIRDNSSFVTVKNSYFFSKDNGRASTLVLAWAENCTIDNNTISGEGGVGNLLYLNVYNIYTYPETVTSYGSAMPANPVNNYNKIINNRIYGTTSSSVSIGLMVEGTYNIIENNTLYQSSISTSFGAMRPYNNTYVGNVMTDGGSLTAQAGSIVYNNNVSGALSTGKESTAYNNTVGGKLTVGQDAKAYNNTVGGGATTGGTNAVIENNTIAGAVTINKVGTTFVGNDVSGTVTVTSNNNAIENNTIISTDDYAVDLKTTTGNNVTGNFLMAKGKYGQDAVRTSKPESTIIEDNRPYDPELVVKVENITVGEDAIINVTVNENLNGIATVIVDGKSYTIDVVNGSGSRAVSDLAPSDYTVTATFVTSSLDYGDGENSTVFNVAKLESDISIEITGAELGNDTVIAVSIPGATGNVTVIVNGKEENITLDKDGKANYTIEKAVADDYNVVVIYPGDKDHGFAYATESFTVPKSESKVELTADSEAKVGVETTISVDVTDGATGTVIVNVNGTEYAINLTETNSLTVAFDKAGEYTVVATYMGDDMYNASESKAATIVVSEKQAANIQVEIPDDIKVGDKIIINVTADTDAEIIVYINGEAQTFLLQGAPLGASLMDVLKYNLDKKVAYEVTQEGIYNVTVIAKENEDFAAQTVTKIFEANKKDAEITIGEITTDIGDTVTINATTESDGALTIKVNGETVTGEYPITKAGTYAVVVESAATDAYNAGFATYTFEVAEPTEQNITVVVDGKEYNATVVNGTATVDTDMDDLIANLTDKLADANDKVANLT